MSWEINTTGLVRQLTSPFYDGNSPTTLVRYSLVALEQRFLPDKGLTWINWDYPRYAYPELDVDYKLTGYDWENRALNWSLVSAPSGATIDSKGLISWTPTALQDGSDFTFTVRMTPQGGTPVDKTFTTLVRSDKFIFTDWVNGVDSPARGGIAQPYKTVRYAQSQHATDGTGMVYIVRGGTSNEGFETSSPTLSDNPCGGFSLNTAEEPILVRNYPNEIVINDCQNLGGSYIASCDFSIIYGLKAINIGLTGVGMGVAQNAVAKLCEVDGMYAWAGINPAAFSFLGGALLDSCVGANTMSSAGEDGTGLPSGVNAQDFVGFSGNQHTGDTFLIDCISYGLDELPTDSISSPTTSFRMKSPSTWDVTLNQGAYNTFYHRCVAANELNSLRGNFQLNAGDSVRHSISVFSDNTVGSLAANIEPNRPSSHSYPLFSISQNNLHCQINGTAFRSGDESFALETDRFLFYNDAFVAGVNFNPFIMNIDSGDLDGTRQGIDIRKTTFYADNESDVSFRIENITYPFSDSNTPVTGDTDPVGGEDNQVLTTSPTPKKVAAGKEWTWNGTTLTGVDI